MKTKTKKTQWVIGQARAAANLRRLIEQAKARLLRLDAKLEEQGIQLIYRPHTYSRYQRIAAALRSRRYTPDDWATIGRLQRVLDAVETVEEQINGYVSNGEYDDLVSAYFRPLNPAD